MAYLGRVMGSTSRGLKYLKRRDTQLKRIKVEEERIRGQKEAALERRRAAMKRGEEITGMDKFELKKLARQRGWDDKWDRRKKKLDARRR